MNVTSSKLLNTLTFCLLILSTIASKRFLSGLFKLYPSSSSSTQRMVLEGDLIANNENSTKEKNPCLGVITNIDYNQESLIWFSFFFIIFIPILNYRIEI